MISVNFIFVLRNRGAPLNDQFALVQLRDDKEGILYPGQWAFPGGVSKGKERVPKRIAKREINEELEIDVSSEELTLFKEVQITRVSGEVIKGFFFIIFLDAVIPFLCKEGVKFEFKKFSEILNLDLPLQHKNIFYELLDRWP